MNTQQPPSSRPDRALRGRQGGSCRVHLTPDELRIIARLAAGSTYVAIAAELRLAPATIAYHANQIQQRLRVGNNAALAAIAVITGILLPGQWPPELSGITDVSLPR